MRDFPDFNWSEFKHKAENILTSALLAISSEQPERLVDASDDVKNQVSNIIADNQTAQIKEVYIISKSTRRKFQITAKIRGIVLLSFKAPWNIIITK